jgi:hypothetical protein
MLGDLISKLSGVCSNETLLSLLPFIDDVQYEQQLIQKEKDSGIFGSFGTGDEIVGTETVGAI